jgi:hypothetical protein
MTASESGERASDGELIVSRWHGNLEMVEHDRIQGWARDLERPEVKLLLRAFDNGVPIADVLAERFRDDLLAAGIGAGDHAFSIDLPQPLPRSQRHIIEVRRADDGQVLPGSPRILEAEVDLPMVDVADIVPATWRGNLELVSREHIEGWAWDPRTPDTPMSLTVLDNGEVIAKVLANRYRKDLEAAGIGSGRHAFTLTIPGGLSPLKRHVIRLIGDSDGCEMPSSPVVIAASSGFDGALQAAIGEAIAGMASADERSAALQFFADQIERVLQQNADAEAGREARQMRKQLARRWGKVAFGDARAQSPALAAAAARRALVIDERVPAAERDAGSSAILSHMRALGSLGYEISFVAAAGMMPDEQASAALEARGIHYCHAPYYASVEEVLQRQGDCFDLIYLHRGPNASKYLALARHYHRRAHIVYSVADLQFLRLARQARIEARPELANLSARMRQAELLAAATANVVITHSDVEAELLRQSVKGCNVHVVPWAVPLRPSSAPWQQRRGVAFIGHFDHAPNIDAARFLVEQIMPRVWRAEPDMPCMLIGGDSSSALGGLERPQVEVLGHVPQPGPIFDRVRVMAAPLRFGAGVKVNVLDSFAAAVPCIMSPIAAEGIPLPDILKAQVANDADAFAVQILRLHAEPEAAWAAAKAGVELIREHYSDAVVVALLKAVVEGRRAAP